MKFLKVAFRVCLLFAATTLTLADSLLNTFENPTKYALNLTGQWKNVDGNYRTIFLVNGQSPGPKIVADQGDWLHITVKNMLHIPVTIHFHGVLQKGTPWSDGVAGITQKAINPGESYVYIFQLINQYGFTWYHAHYRGYLSDGVYGPLYIRPSENIPRPYKYITNDTETLNTFLQLEKDPLFLVGDDRFKWTMDEVISRMETYGIDPLCAESILVNGMGRVYCHDQSQLNQLLTKMPSHFQLIDSMGCIPVENGFENAVDVYGLEMPGYSKKCIPTNAQLYTLNNENEWMYLNILNSGGQFTKAFSIDSHTMYIVAVDGIFVQPFEAHQIIIPVGSRISVLVRAKQGSYPIRFAVSKMPQILEGKAILNNNIPSYSINATKLIRYQGIDGKLLNESYKTFCPNDTVPFEDSKKYNLTAKKGDHTFNLMLSRRSIIQFSMFSNGELLPQDLERNHALIQKLNLSEEASAHKWIMDDNIKRNDIVDIILNNDGNATHPVHLHGHLFYVLSSSEVEDFPYSSVEEALEKGHIFRKEVPLVDIAFIPPRGHAVIRFIADNPGLWLFHCHNLGHLLGGMGALLAEDIDAIPKRPSDL